jgi:predicted transcriptional regulator
MEKKASPLPEHRVLVDVTARIVASYVGNNRIRIDAINDVIGTVFSSLAQVEGASPRPIAVPQPAVPVKKSIFPDHLVCLEDGLKLKMLKRHLRTSYGLTPEQYRAKWSLPADYPMAAPNYTLSRSEFAKKSGFGTKKTRKWVPRKAAAAE